MRARLTHLATDTPFEERLPAGSDEYVQDSLIVFRRAIESFVVLSRHEYIELGNVDDRIRTRVAASVLRSRRQQIAAALSLLLSADL